MSVSAQENQLRDGVYRGLINGLPNAAVLVFDTEQRYLMAHGDVLRTYQLFPESAKGKTPFEIMPKPIAQRVTHWYQRVLQGESIQEEISYETITFQLRIQPITNDAGEIIAGMVIAQDMTPLKQTQAQLEQRVKQLTILSEVESELSEHLNIDYVLTMALDSAVRLSEADAGFIALVDEEHLRHPHIIGDYRQTTLYADYKQPWGTISRAIKHQQAELIANVKADADYVAILPNTCAQIVVPLMAQDKLVGVLNLETSKAERFTPQTLDFVKLITSRVAMAIDNARLYQQTAEQLTEMPRLYQHVSKLEQLKTDMILIASHDLRNPLVVIINYLQMLISSVSLDDPKVKEYAHYIDIAARKMDRIIRNILSVKRVEEIANEQFTFSQIDLLALSQQIYHDHLALAQLKKITYTFDHDVSGDFLIYGDDMHLGEAMGNLIGNAIKYTPNEGQIKISLHHDGNTVRYQVVDTGYGIKEAQHANLFQPFFRAKSPETRDIEGTGLGLHLVKNIIEQHGGTMIFESVYGQGSVFGFELTLPATN